MLPRGAYERMRANAARFILRAGHEADAPSAWWSGGDADAYVVVEKAPVQASIAEETDPRA
jgi:hypothetical protein